MDERVALRASPVEKLDALSWVTPNVLTASAMSFRIQLAWMRQSPPDTPNPGWLFTKRVRQMKALLAEGIRFRRNQDRQPVE